MNSGAADVPNGVRGQRECEWQESKMIVSVIETSKEGGLEGWWGGLANGTRGTSAY